MLAHVVFRKVSRTATNKVGCKVNLIVSMFQNNGFQSPIFNIYLARNFKVASAVFKKLNHRVYVLVLVNDTIAR